MSDVVNLKKSSNRILLTSELAMQSHREPTPQKRWCHEILIYERQTDMSLTQLQASLLQQVKSNTPEGAV